MSDTWDAEAAALIAADRIMSIDARKRTRAAMTDIIADEIGSVMARLRELEQRAAERADRAEDAYRASERRVASTRDTATDDLAELAVVAESHADAHIATIKHFSERSVDRFVMRRADERERGVR